VINAELVHWLATAPEANSVTHFFTYDYVWEQALLKAMSEQLLRLTHLRMVITFQELVGEKLISSGRWKLCQEQKLTVNTTGGLGYPCHVLYKVLEVHPAIITLLPGHVRPYVVSTLAVAGQPLMRATSMTGAGHTTTLAPGAVPVLVGSLDTTIS